MMEQSVANSADTIAVGLCTYKRPAGLARTLQFVGQAVQALGRDVQIVVVDNDGADPEVGAIVHAFGERSGLRCHYIVEPTPGISAARNAVFDKMTALGVRFVAMLDDDEWPSPEWLVELLAEQRRTSATVVGGPVFPVFPDDAKSLEPIARFWSVLPQKLHGKVLVFCTCNFLIDMRAIAGIERPLFDEAFGLSGGGDTVFFRRLFFAGHEMAWADRALIHEEVPVSRASLKWMRGRRVRTGNHAVQWEVLERSPMRSMLKTVALTGRLAIYPLLSREPESRMVGWLLECEKIRGRFKAHIGSGIVEYARPNAAGAAACR